MVINVILDFVSMFQCFALKHAPYVLHQVKNSAKLDFHFILNFDVKSCHIASGFKFVNSLPCAKT